MNKRWSIVLVASLLVLAMTSLTHAQITLYFNTPFHSGDAQAMERIVAAFNEAHDDVQIILTQGQWAEYYSQLYNSVIAGNAPQLAITHTTRLQQMLPALTPLNDSPAGDLLAYAGISRDQYIADLWDAGTWEGNQYFIPLDTHMWGLWYNRDIFEAAGLDPDNPPTTREELEAAADAIRDKTGKYAIHWAEDALARKVRRAWYVLYWQLGGELLNEDMTQATFNNEKGLQALRYLVDSVHSRGWNHPAGDGFKQFAAGELGMLVAGNWYYWTAEEAGVNYGFHYMPTIFDTRKTWGDSHNIVIPVQRGVSDEVLKAAIMAAKWISENSAAWGVYGGHIPANNKVRESEELIQSHTWQTSLAKFAEMAEQGALRYDIDHQEAARISEAIEVYIQQAYNGTMSPEDALARAEREVNEILRMSR